MNDEKFWMCERKKQYRSEKSALNFLRVNIRKQGLIIPSNAHAYRCPYCGYFHLGHKK